MTISLSRNSRAATPKHAAPEYTNLTFVAAGTVNALPASTKEVSLPYDAIKCTKLVSAIMSHPANPRMGLMTAINTIEGLQVGIEFDRNYWLSLIVPWAFKNDFIQRNNSDELFMLCEFTIEKTDRNWLFVDLLRAFITAQLLWRVRSI